MLMIYKYDHSGHKPEAWTMLSLQNCNGSLTVWGSVLLVQQRMNIISYLIALHIVPSGTDSQSCFGAQPSGSNSMIQSIIEALRSLTQPLLDCILYLTLTQYRHDPGTSPSSADQCILGTSIDPIYQPILVDLSPFHLPCTLHQ